MSATDQVGTAGAGGATSDRWALLWQGFFAATLAIPTVLAVAAAPDVATAVTTAGIAAGFGIWHWWMAIRRLDREGRPEMLWWFAGALLFTWVLLARDPRYIILVYGLYPQIFWLLGKFAIPGAAALTLVAFGLNGSISLDADGMLSLAGNVALAVMIGLFVTALVRQNAARKQALDELEATRAELAETAKRAGILEERQRIARDLHDTVAQGFTGIVMQLQASEEALDADPQQARDHLRRASESARSGLNELRRVAHALRPEALEGTSLAEAISTTVDQWSADTGIATDQTTRGPSVSLGAASEVALLRALQESLANIAKHAGASEVHVHLSFDGAGATLVVRDDGAGFDGPPGEGQGLRGMAERIAEVNGALRVDAHPGAGTTVTASVPAA